VTSRSSSTDAEKAEQRAGAKRAAAQRAAAVKRKEKLGVAAVAVAGVLAVALIVAVSLYLMNRDKNTTDTASTANPSASAPAADQSPQPPAEQPAGDFPPLPEGADPALKNEPKVTAGSGAAPTELVVKKLIEGKGAAVKSGQTISVNYTGVLFATGQPFDSSWTRKQAAEFAIGVGGVIPGWDKGLVGVPIGSRVQLDIPAALAYGDKPAQGYPKGALRFVVDVLGAK
jgi:peptidylprolyl isomerase